METLDDEKFWDVITILMSHDHFRVLPLAFNSFNSFGTFGIVTHTPTPTPAAAAASRSIGGTSRGLGLLVKVERLLTVKGLREH